MNSRYLTGLVLAAAALLAIGCSGDDPSTPGNDSGAGDAIASPASTATVSTSSTSSASFLMEIDSAAGDVAAPAGSAWQPVDRWWERQQLPGTAQGCWYRWEGAAKKATRTSRLGDPHLALVGIEGSNGAPLIACGPGLDDLDPGAYAFAPLDAGFYNRPFSAVIPDGNVYAVYLDLWVDRTVLLQMPDDDTLWIEAFAGPPGEPAAWSFTSEKLVFER